MISVEEAVDWVLEHRAGKVFKGQTAQQIEWAISRAINCRGFAYTEDERGRLVGLICATPNSVEKTLRVHEILTIDKRSLPGMIEQFKKQFEGYTITAKRRGREIRYKTDRLVRKLSAV